MERARKMKKKVDLRAQCCDIGREKCKKNALCAPYLLHINPHKKSAEALFLLLMAKYCPYEVAELADTFLS